jgi:hypothetical protein
VKTYLLPTRDYSVVSKLSILSSNCILELGDETTPVGFILFFNKSRGNGIEVVIAIPIGG